MDLTESKVRKKLSPEEALPKIQSWCAYQERAHAETKKKLLSYGLSFTQSEEIITALITSNFLNEERFAIAFAGGKFRMKGWGKLKIKIELRKRGVSEHNIGKALQGIEQVDYLSTLKRLLTKKITSSGEKQQDRRIFFSALSYASSRGFEHNLAEEVLRELLGDQNA